jgi:hypothetical protein
MKAGCPVKYTRKKVWREKVLEHVQACLGVRKACELSGVTMACVYKELRENPEFRAEWYRRMDESVVVLEAEAVRRAAMGSDYVLMRLLASRASARYGDGQLSGETHTITPNINLHISIANEPDAQ